MIASFFYHAMMFVGALWCHQLPERSPHILGAQMPLCWRCTGIAVGTVFLISYLLARRKLPVFNRATGLLLALLLPLDVLLNIFVYVGAGNERRFLSGLLWGFFGTSLCLHLIGRAAELSGSHGKRFKRAGAATEQAL